MEATSEYKAVIDRMKEVKAGVRGWMSLTEASKECKVPKLHLSQVARAIGLTVQNHGRYGLCASREN